MARLWRVHYPDLPGRPGTQIRLDSGESRHLVRVLRLLPGDRVAVFDGQGSEWSALLVSAEREHVELRLEDPIGDAVESPFEVGLYQGLCKPDRMDWVIQKATEIGMTAVHVLPTDRSESRRGGAPRLGRWRRIAVEACKQSGRRCVPRIELCTSPPALDPSTTLGLVLDPGQAAPPLASLLEGAAPGGAQLISGPEAGLSAEEVEAWCAAGWRRVRLGPRILRADTAGVVAATILLHRWGDLGS